ncbi:MAG: Gx transporter family protein [Spirochaetia bacterium]
MQKSTRQLSNCSELIALFGAFCLFLSTVEFMIPKPLPFFRLGLANIPVILSIYLFKPKYTIMLILLKILGQGLINGTLFSYIFIFSAAGSLASGLVMITGFKIFGKRISLIGISILGALASNVSQIFFARMFIFGTGAWLIGPPILVIGLISSIVLGFFSEQFFRNSSWIREITGICRND